MDQIYNLSDEERADRNEYKIRKNLTDKGEV